MKLHRLSMGHLYSGWAAPSTWLHSASPDTACKAAALAAWSHAVKVCLLCQLLTNHLAATLHQDMHIPGAWCFYVCLLTGHPAKSCLPFANAPRLPMALSTMKLTCLRGLATCCHAKHLNLHVTGKICTTMYPTQLIYLDSISSKAPLLKDTGV